MPNQDASKHQMPEYRPNEVLSRAFDDTADALKTSGEITGGGKPFTHVAPLAVSEGPIRAGIFDEILVQLRIMNTYLSELTGEEITEEDIQWQ